jgi:hypothetical protein
MQNTLITSNPKHQLSFLFCQQQVIWHQQYQPGNMRQMSLIPQGARSLICISLIPTLPYFSVVCKTVISKTRNFATDVV